MATQFFPEHTESPYEPVVPIIGSEADLEARTRKLEKQAKYLSGFILRQIARGETEFPASAGRFKKGLAEYDSGVYGAVRERFQHQGRKIGFEVFNQLLIPIGDGPAQPVDIIVVTKAGDRQIAKPDYLLDPAFQNRQVV